MADKSGTNTPAISLPKGGGAIKGIGETFQPNLFSGTGDFSVPIYTSPGRNGFGPKLALHYSTGSGSGPFGMGWQLSIPRVTRKTEKGLPTYTDKDVFVVSGAEDLVPVLDNNGDPINISDQGDYKIARYRPRTEGLFARIEKWANKNDAEDIHWRVTTKENVTSIYGKTKKARIIDPDPDKATHIFEWLLEETFDAKGNHILYEYIQEDPDFQISEIYETNRRYTQTYIRRILYGNTPVSLNLGMRVGPTRDGIDHSANNATNSKNRHYVFEVLFDYGDLPDEPIIPFDFSNFPENPDPKDWPESSLREDPFSSFRSGFEIRTLRRCKRVLMLHHFKEGELIDAPLVKSTYFEYKINDDTKISFLNSVKVTGYRKDPDDNIRYLFRDMPPVTFEYSEFKPQEQEYQSVQAMGNDLPPRPLTDANFTLFDLFGDGLPDILNTTAFDYYYWQNLGYAHIDRRHPQHGAIPAGITLSDPNVAVGDMGGDGLPDLIVQSPQMAGFYEAIPDGKWKPFKRFMNFPSIDLSDPNLRLLDLTGDGLSDMLVTRDHHFLWFKCLGEEGYADPEYVERRHDLDEFPDVFFDDPSGRVRLADMTGDGLNDIVLVHDGRIDYWPNLGYGEFGKRITMENSPRIGLEYNFDPRRLFLVDLDGTGCTDLVYVDFDCVHFWFNRSGNGWSEKQTIHGTPYVTDLSAVQFADFFGTGTACLVWSYNYGEQPDGNYKVLDFCGCIKPHVLNEMSNNMGATTRAQYVPSTKFYLEDKKNGEPWVTNLPFPVQVLEKTEVIDHISKTKLVTNYKYHHGYFDGREREFRGFGRVDQLDTEVFGDFTDTSLHGNAEFTNKQKAFHVPPVLTKTWFHTGVYFDGNLPSASGIFYDKKDMMDAYKAEFYKGDSKSFELEEHIVNKDDTPHEAYRALRGAILRSEVYALDGTEKEPHPYTVSENRYEVRRLQKRFSNNHAVYLTKQKEGISYHYEQNPDDPRVVQQLTIKFDDWGNVIESATVGYPRRPAFAFHNEQQKIKSTYTWSKYIKKNQQDDHYYIGINCETKIFEVHGLNWQWPAGGARPVPLKDTDLAGITNTPDHFLPYLPVIPLNPAGIEKRIVDWKRIYFRQNTDPRDIDAVDSTDHRLDLGQIESLGLPYETYQVAFTDNMLQDIYSNRLNNISIENEGGYRKEDNYWWIPSGKQGFSSQKFFQPIQSQDPFGNKTTTVLDDYALLVNKVIDALPGTKANVYMSWNDYRVLQPYEVKDPNCNGSAVAFDALGLVVGTAIFGEDENGNLIGDSLDEFVPDLPDDLRDRHIDDPLDEDPAYDTDPHNILKNATTRLVYNLKQFMDNGDPNDPNVVYTLSRETHSKSPGGAASKIQHSFIYSDGFGREVQTKVQAEPGPLVEGGVVVDPRWVGTGTKIYNNKGKNIQQYEPFFSNTHKYGVEQHGVSPTLFYDPLERVVCTIHPNHTYEKVVFDPWHQETWDVNDTVLSRSLEDNDVNGYVGEFINTCQQPFKTWYDERILDRNNPPANPTPEQRAALLTKAHAGTPTISYLDTLGRPFLTVANNGEDNAGADVLFKTHIELDIEGNDIKITDPRQYELNTGRAANARIHNFIHWFDIAGRKLRIDSRDAGLQLSFLDVAGQPVYSWDGVGRTNQTKYDQLRRPEELWVKEKDAVDFYLAQKTIYGEDKPNPEKTHHRMQAWKVYDGAGLAASEIFDFKGNLLKQGRILLDDGKIQVQWPTTGVNFNERKALDERLEPIEKEYTACTEFDALNRVINSTLPDGTIQELIYNEANLLNSLHVTVNGIKKTYVKNIDYNAKGQRTKIFYGQDNLNEYTFNTTYKYDPETFRLSNIISERKGSNKPDLQVLSYAYDPVGNITSIRDDAHKLVFNRNNIIKPESQYEYDPLYRLVKASGREHQAMTACHYREYDEKHTEIITLENQPTNNGQALGNFVENYEYDKAGNITLIDHNNLTFNKHWKRDQEYDPNSNRIKSSKAGCPDESSFDMFEAHDENGSITKFPHLQVLNWNFRNQLVEVQLNVGGTPNKAYYQYDANGQRVRKTMLKNGTTEERIYLGGYEIYKKDNGVNSIRRDTIHVMDDKNRIALIELEKDPANGNMLPNGKRIRYQLSNHLGSAVMEVDDTPNAKIISYEEYYPYGGTAYLAGTNKTEAKRKRYRYSRKERDDETGMYYYGARYYASWLGRLCSCDPVGIKDSLNLFMFVHNNPLIYIDHIGTNGENIEYTQVEKQQQTCLPEEHPAQRLKLEGYVPTATISKPHAEDRYARDVEQYPSPIEYKRLNQLDIDPAIDYWADEQFHKRWNMLIADIKAEEKEQILNIQNEILRLTLDPQPVMDPSKMPAVDRYPGSAGTAGQPLWPSDLGLTTIDENEILLGFWNQAKRELWNSEQDNQYKEYVKTWEIEQRRYGEVTGKTISSNLARAAYANVRGRWGKLLSQAGINISGMEVEHFNSPIWLFNLQAVDPRFLVLTQNRRIHQMSHQLKSGGRGFNTWRAPTRFTNMLPTHEHYTRLGRNTSNVRRKK